MIRLPLCFFFLMIRRPPRSTLFPLHDALPIFSEASVSGSPSSATSSSCTAARSPPTAEAWASARRSRSACPRSEEHTSELQSRQYLVCRLLLEKKKKTTNHLLHCKGSS